MGSVGKKSGFLAHRRRDEYSHNRFRILQHAGLWSKRGHWAWSMQGTCSPEGTENNQ